MRIEHFSRPIHSAALLSAAALALWSMAPARAASASSAPQLAVTVEVEREVIKIEAGGKKSVEREPVDVARPGDVLVYTLKAENQGDAPAFDVKLQDPIPQGTVLIMDPLDQAPTSASLDGGKTWQSFPATLVREKPGGDKESVPAPAEAYTNLRWLVREAVAPRSASAVSFRVRVL